VGLPSEGLVPIPVAVVPPAEYRTVQGQTVREDESELLVRLPGGRPLSLHKAFAATAAAATAVAAPLPGSVAAEVSRAQDAETVVLGHPSGTFPVRVRVTRAGDAWHVERATYSRTARRLMEGYAFVKAAVFAELGQSGGACTGTGPPSKSSTTLPSRNQLSGARCPHRV